MCRKVYIEVCFGKRAWKKEVGGIRYGKPYTSRSPTAVFQSLLPVLDALSGSRGPDYARINAAQGSSMTLEQRSELLWGSRRYRDPATLVLEEDGLVGLVKAQPNTGKNIIAESVDAFLAFHGLNQFVIRTDDTGYVALFSHDKTTLHVRYFSGDDSAVIHRYGVCSSKSAQHRKRELMRAAPKPYEEGWRNGTLTEDIGVLVYDHVSLLSPNGVKVSVQFERKKPCTYNPGKYLVDHSLPAVAAYLRTEMPYAFASSFPSAAEKEKVREGYSVEFTLRFKGYRAVGEADAHRDKELQTAYDHGLRSGIHAILWNIYSIISAQRQYDVQMEVPAIQIAK